MNNNKKVALSVAKIKSELILVFSVGGGWTKQRYFKIKVLL